MSWFARIEEACAGFIERAFANMFPSDVEPAQIARKLVATMEARTQAEDGTMTAPSRYAAYVHPVDFERLTPHRKYLEEEWSALLREVAQRVGITLAASPMVELRESGDIVAGAIEIGVLDDVRSEEPARNNHVLVLRMLKGMPADARFPVTQTLRVGRNTQAEIFLVDPSVSRNHAVVEFRGRDVVVRDAGSTNGTFVNGERVQMHTLRPGDRVAFGKTEMAVDCEERA
jgi:hypothetical protein